MCALMEHDIAGLISKAVPRAEIVGATTATVGSVELAEVRVRFEHPGPLGEPRTGSGRIYVPVGSIEPYLEDGALAPLVYASGYEQGPESLLGYLALGAVGASSVADAGTPEAAPDARNNPLARGINLDVAMLHLARSLPFVDVGRVMLTGGSAGGFMGLMLAAETFPLSGALISSPVVNVPYNLSYLRANASVVAADPKRLPILAVVVPLVEGAEVLYGVDLEGPDYQACSPHAHLELITGKVLVVHSSADVLVPVDQIDPASVLEWGEGEMPDGFVMSPKELGLGDITTLSSGWPGAVEHMALPEGVPEYPSRYPYDPMPEPVPGPHLGWPPSGMRIVILDEGPPGAVVGHFRYAAACGWPIAEATAGSAGGTCELTLAKLTALMKRATGRDWVGGSHRSLDFAEAERADVLAGLRWWGAEPERRAVLEDLYSRLPKELQGFGHPLDLT